MARAQYSAIRASSSVSRSTSYTAKVASRLSTKSKSLMKILVAIANYGVKNDQYLSELLAAYTGMSHQVDVVVLSNVPKDLGPGVEVLVGLPAKDPWSLPFVHKRLFAERRNDYDLFIYSEDDMLITEKNISAFLRVNDKMLGNEIPGFLRFERDGLGRVNYPEVHGHFHWDPETVQSRGEYTLALFTNEHSACYVLTRDQLRAAIDSDGFLREPYQGKYDLLCTAATDPYTKCGFRKLICISHLEDFLVHHLPNKYIGSGLGVEEHEFRRQVETLLRIGRNGQRPASLFPTESKLPGARYSKNYYEPINPAILATIPSSARRVLSIGCGWGATEGALADKGLRVTAVPLDPVIPGGAEAKGVELLQGCLSAAAERLASERFDCLLLLNVLHLVPDPVSVLSTFSGLLRAGSSAVVSMPNMLQAPVLWGKIRGDVRYGNVGDYEATGVHFTSEKTVRGWFRRAGMRPEKTAHVLPRRAKLVSRLTLGIADSVLASEIIGVGRAA